MKYKTILTLLIPIIILMGSCDLFDKNVFKAQVLQGSIQNNSFEFVSGYAADNWLDNTLWTISMYKVQPVNGMDAWQEGAYQSSYPYVVFTIRKDSSPQVYEISTFGSAGVSLTGYVTALSGTFFDEGELEITEIDLNTETISGRIWAVTFDSDDELNGNFTVAIDPASIN